MGLICYVFVAEESTASLTWHKPDRNNWKHQTYVTNKGGDIKTVVYWTTLDNQNVQELTSWRHCSNDFKGSCVLTINKTEYEV